MENVRRTIRVLPEEMRIAWCRRAFLSGSAPVGPLDRVGLTPEPWTKARILMNTLSGAIQMGSIQFGISPIRICTMAQIAPALSNSRKRWSTPTVFDSYFYIHVVLDGDLRTSRDG